MFESISNFWRVFWGSIKNAYAETCKKQEKTDVQDFEDIVKRNYAAQMANALSNLVNTEATFQLVSDSEIAKPLQRLKTDLENRRYEITMQMLGNGGYFGFPEISDTGEVNHTFVPQKDVLIVKTIGNVIYDIYGIINTVTLKNGKIYKLVRHHKVDPRTGDLTIDYDIRDGVGNRTTYEPWQEYTEQQLIYPKANHIGISYYKSPVDSRGLSPIYGVPINFSCAEVEKDIVEFEKRYKTEFKNADSKVFADPRVLVEDSETKQYNIPENIFPMRTMAGAGNGLSIYNPNIRQTEYAAMLEKLYVDYEKTVGTNRGVLSDFEYSANATKDEVRRANADTIALLEKIRNALHIGNEEMLKADSLYLGIPFDYWTYKSEWYDPFENPDTQWQRLTDALNNKSAERSDLVKWLFPTLNDDEVAEKMARIDEVEAQSINKSIENMLNL